MKNVIKQYSRVDKFRLTTIFVVRTEKLWEENRINSPCCVAGRELTRMQYVFWKMCAWHTVQIIVFKYTILQKQL